MIYLTTHSTHFIYGYMASDIWLRCCCCYCSVFASNKIEAVYLLEDSGYQEMKQEQVADLEKSMRERGGNKGRGGGGGNNVWQKLPTSSKRTSVRLII